MTTSIRRTSTFAVLLCGLLLGGTIGYLWADSQKPEPAPAAPDYSAELVQLRAELDQVKAQSAPISVDDQLAQLQAIVTDILLRGDEFSLRADFARTADRLEGHSAEDFALIDADKDGTSDVEQLRKALADILSGATPVGRATKADTAANAESFANVPPAGFAQADHSHSVLAGNLRLQNDVRVDGALAVIGNVAASGDVQVFGEVVAVGGLIPGSVPVAAKPALAGVIRYNRDMGILEYCDGARWNAIAVVQEP